MLAQLVSQHKKKPTVHKEHTATFIVMGGIRRWMGELCVTELSRCFLGFLVLARDLFEKQQNGMTIYD